MCRAKSPSCGHANAPMADVGCRRIALARRVKVVVTPRTAFALRRKVRLLPRMTAPDWDDVALLLRGDCTHAAGWTSKASGSRRSTTHKVRTTLGQ